MTFLADPARVQMRCLLSQLDLLESQREQLDLAIDSLMGEVPQFTTTISAVGAAILAQIAEVTRFATPGSLIAYAGMDATVYETGEFKGMHMGKRHSAYLRMALRQAASMAIRHNAELRELCDRKKAQEKNHDTIIGTVSRKLLARIHMVLKEQRPYVNR